MISADRDALLCDFAETYGIYDFGGVPVSTLATLAVGLRENSRIKMHMSGTVISRTDMLLAAAVDRLSLLCWAQTEDGQRNVNQPQSVLSIILGQKIDHERQVQAYETGRDFANAWKEATGVEHWVK